MTRRRNPILTPTSVTVGETLKVYATKEMANAKEFLLWRGGRFHTGVHHTRKSLRRVRSVLRMGVAEFGRGGKILDRELKHIIRSLSTLRDAHSLVEVLDRLKKTHGASEFSSLLMRARRAAIQKRIQITRAALRGDVNFTSRRMVLSVLAGGIHELPWDSVKERSVQESLVRAKAALDNAMGKAENTGREADWHRWRRRSRRLSEQSTAVGSIANSFGKTATPSGKSDQLLGKAQDYVLLLNHCKAGHPFDESDKKELQAMAKAAIKVTREHAREVAPQYSNAGNESA